MLTPQELIRGTALLVVEGALVKERLEHQLAEMGTALAEVAAERDALRTELEALIEDREADHDGEGA